MARKRNGKMSGGGEPAKQQSQLQRLGDLVRRSSHRHPHLTTRLEKAAFLVLLRPIERVGQDHYRIGSEDGLRQYEVINGHCQCSDYLRHGAGHPCKHRLALSLLRSLGGPRYLPDEATGVDPALDPEPDRDQASAE